MQVLLDFDTQSEDGPHKEMQLSMIGKLTCEFWASCIMESQMYNP